MSRELTEVRTVLSRAETALGALVELSYRGNEKRGHYVPKPTTEPDGPRIRWHLDGYLPPSGHAPDPDVEDMHAALEQVVALLARWRKAGKTRRR